MAYIRTKKISDNLYCYLVENKQTKNGPRQKVKKYLGKAITLEAKKELDPEFNLKLEKKELLLDLIRYELLNHSFKKKDDLLINQKVVFNLNELKATKGKKEVVLKLNEGFLCNFTLKRILAFKKTNDINEDALKLARYFVEAGINIPKDVFVEFYQKKR
ncbi:MAG: hypothetical protein ABIA37_05510 [Candidatus Woesearchaeota archaeon]